MGKFYDAMQRALQGVPAPRSGGAAAMPELDTDLLHPEGDSEDAHGVTPFSASGRLPREWGETPSAVIRSIESAVSGANPPSSVPSADAAEEAEGQDDVELDGVSAPPLDVKRVRFGSRELTRGPVETVVRVHPAYDRVIQRLISFRKTPRQGVVLVTSSVAREGTSTIARNVATALSQSGSERVLLLDANLRNPTQHEAFGCQRESGFSELLQEQIPLGAAVRDDMGSGISVMPAGAPVRSPSLVLKGGSVKGVVTALLSIYDWIIVDSPPATEYPDVSTLGSACGAGILVVRAESTRLEVTEAAKEILDNSGVQTLGAVLNRRRYHIPNFIYRRL